MTLRPLLFAGVAIALMLLLASLSLHYIADDSFITFRYVQRFLDGKGLTWTEGEYVEGYSNALWAWVLILAGLLGAPIPAASQTLGIACCVLTILAVFALDWNKAKQDSNDYLWAKFVGALTLSFSGIFTVWSVGGLEQPLLVALLSWLFVFLAPLLDSLDDKNNSNQNFFIVSFLLSLLVAIRPDGAIYTAILAFIIVTFGSFSKASFINAFKLSLFPFISWCALTLFRLYYYGDLVPNTAHAKLAFSLHHMTHYGISYIYRGFGLLFPLVLAIPVLFFFSLQKNWYRARICFLTATIVIWSIYLVVIGGDVDPPSRHFMPIVVILAFMLVAFISYLQQYQTQHLSRTNIFLFSLAFCFYGIINFFEAEVRDARASVNRFGDNNEMVISFSRLLKTAFEKSDPLIAVYAAGIPPYFTEFRAIDMLGLNDRHIAMNPPKSFGTGWIAHELSDPDYLLGRKPDIIAQGGGGRGCGWNACLDVTHDLLAHPEFIKNYVRTRLVHTSAPIVDGYFWVRRDGRCGASTDSNKIKIPAIISNSDGSIPFFLDTEKRITGIATKDTPIKLDTLTINNGSWQIEIDPPYEQFITTSKSCEIDNTKHILKCNHSNDSHSLEIKPSGQATEFFFRNIILTQIASADLQ
jgi:arabinofuranosyltransferase